MVERRRRSLSSGSKIGKYELREAIRRQPERSLFNAYDPFLDRIVAIKIIQLFAPNCSEQREAADTFFSEARAIARLQHQNIVSVYDAGMGDYEGYMVMEYVRGQSLLQRLKQIDRLPIDEALHVAIQVCHALRYAHAKGIVHRDIKPSNIMLTDDGQVKLVDFGISFVKAENDTSVPNLMGTPSYMAPELVDAKCPSEHSDQFSLGVVLYEMVTGRLPFAGQDAHGVLYKIINEEPAAVEEGCASLSKLIFKMLAKEPQDRFNSVLDLEQELQILVDLAKKVNDTTSGMDTMRLKNSNVFADCEIETLQELAHCSQIVSFEKDELIVSESTFRGNDYYYVLEGRMQTGSAESFVVTSTGEWLADTTILTMSEQPICKALMHSQVLQICGDKLESGSLSVRAYFYRNLAQNLIPKSYK